MNSEITIKQNIEKALKDFLDDQLPLRDVSKKLLNTLGYYSGYVSSDELDKPRYDSIKKDAEKTANPTDRLCFKEWEPFSQVLQVTDAEIKAQIITETTQFESKAIDNELRSSYMFIAMPLTGDAYTRTQLANIMRFISMRIPQPFMVIFRYGSVLTLGIINRRQSKKDENKQVLEKVTLIKDIDLADPKRAHIEIVFDLHLRKLIEDKEKKVHNFDTLHDAWEVILNTEELNKRFYSDLEEWYEWAIKECKFPDKENKMQVIRMLTRILFIWFLKEKKHGGKQLVPEDIFQEDGAKKYLNNFDYETSDYYQAILQNLFFATLNTPIDKRAFREPNDTDDTDTSTKQSFNPPPNPDHRNANKYRYYDLLQDGDEFLEDLKQVVPFVNGGLFDSLDSFKGQKAGGKRVDCFTDWQKHRKKLHVPAKLFFKANHGLYPIFNRYKFTVEENTPVDQEVALDPELLGQVFENLLGVHNPETEEAARKATGSYYTPRNVVNYMVDEALIAYFLQKVKPYDNNREWLETRIREDLLAYDQLGEKNKIKDHLIHKDEIESLIQAIDDLKILDPAVGSGAFPMGILNKLVLILKKLDPENERWKQQQLTPTEDIVDPKSKEKAVKAIEDVFSEANQYNNYSRKLVLIQKCIYGVDIQPIAVTIAKLRFFISLVIEQKQNSDPKDNYGIDPLPNLETKFVAANTLIGLKKLQQSDLQAILEDPTIKQLKIEIDGIRKTYFSENDRQKKLDYIKDEEEHRNKLAKLITTKHLKVCEEKQRDIDFQIDKLKTKKQKIIIREKLEKKYKASEAIIAAAVAEAKQIANWNPYNQNVKADFFDPEWMFNIIEGFDVVIGNPPYIQLQKDGGKLRKLYQNKGFDTFVGSGDIYCLFYERGILLLKGDGHLCYITSNKWLRTSYGEKLRDYFFSRTQPIQLLYIGPDVFDATVDTNILLLQNTVRDDQTGFKTVKFGADYDKQSSSISQHLKNNKVIMDKPAKGQVWSILTPSEINLKDKIKNVGKPLKEWDINICFGIKTGCNEAFIINEAKREILIEQDPKSAEIIKPLLQGKDMECYHTEWKKRYLINTFPALKLDINDYPTVKNYLLEFGKDRLEQSGKKLSDGTKSRKKTTHNWFETQDTIAYYHEFDKEKIVWKRIGSILRFAYVQNPMLCLDSTCIATGRNVKFLTAVLNSKVSHFQLFNIAPTTGTGDLIVSVQAIEPILVPPITDENRNIVDKIEKLVDRILAAKAANPAANTTDLEKEIDKLVYTLYDLTKKERAIVERAM